MATTPMTAEERAAFKEKLKSLNFTAIKVDHKVTVDKHDDGVVETVTRDNEQHITVRPDTIRRSLSLSD